MIFRISQLRRLFHILVGWDGMGWVDVDQKFALFFFLGYIKHYTHIYLNVYKKLSAEISCGF